MAGPYAILPWQAALTAIQYSPGGVSSGGRSSNPTSAGPSGGTCRGRAAGAVNCQVPYGDTA